MDPRIQMGLTGNVFVYLMTFWKAGDVFESHEHAYDHISLLAKGRMRVESNGKHSEYAAQHIVAIPKGVKHRLVALEDGTVWSCIHALHAKDNPGDILDPSMIPAGTPAWAFAVPLEAEQARRAGVVLEQTKEPAA